MTVLNDVFLAGTNIPVHVLDTGSAIEADSLATGSRRLYWTNGSAPRSAPIR
jgi:hypothetical protein